MFLASLPTRLADKRLRLLINFNAGLIKDDGIIHIVNGLERRISRKAEGLHRLDLDDQPALDDEVSAEPNVHRNRLVDHRD